LLLGGKLKTVRKERTWEEKRNKPLMVKKDGVVIEVRGRGILECYGKGKTVIRLHSYLDKPVLTTNRNVLQLVRVMI